MYIVDPTELNIIEALRFLDVKYKYARIATMARYIVDKNIVGMGYINWVIILDEDWQITISNFITPNSTFFRKTILVKYNSSTRRMERCHAMYLDEADLEKKGGSSSQYTPAEILISLIHHYMNYNETTCESCRGEHKNQTHFIELI